MHMIVWNMLLRSFAILLTQRPISDGYYCVLLGEHPFLAAVGECQGTSYKLEPLWAMSKTTWVHDFWLCSGLSHQGAVGGCRGFEISTGSVACYSRAF
jgi:hypothetical protein